MRRLPRYVLDRSLRAFSVFGHFVDACKVLHPILLCCLHSLHLSKGQSFVNHTPVALGKHGLGSNVVEKQDLTSNPPSLRWPGLQLIVSSLLNVGHSHCAYHWPRVTGCRMILFKNNCCAPCVCFDYCR